MANRKTLKNTLRLLLGGFIGYSFFEATSDPKSPLNKKIPEERIKNIEILPSLEIISKKKMYHFHHWMDLSILYLLYIGLRRKLLKSKILNGIMLGGILQGMTYKDRFKIVEKEEKV